MINVIIYDIKCENGHIFEGWFNDRQAWIKQNAQRLVNCPVCNSSTVEVVPTSIAIRGKVDRSGPKDTQENLSPERVLRTLNDYVHHQFEDVGNQFAEVALKIHYGEEEKRNIRGTTTPQEEDQLREEGVRFIKIPLPKMDS